MAEFEVGVQLTPEAGSAKRFETEALNIAKRIEPQIQKAFTITDALAKRMLAPYEKEAKRIAKGISVQVSAKVDQNSIAKSQAAIQKAFNKSPITQKIQVDTESVTRSIPAVNAANSALGQLNNTTRLTTSTILRFAAGFIGAGGAIAGFTSLVQSAVSAGTTLDTQLRALDNLTGVLGANAEESFAKIQAAANKLPGTFSDVQSGVIQLASVLGQNLNQSVATFELLTGAALASGKGLGNVNGAITQLSQISAKGRLQLEELSIIAENIPGLKVAAVIEQVAKAMGVTTEEARKLLSQGLVPASVGIQAILDVAKNVPGATEAIANSANSLEAVFSSLRDAVQVGLGKAFIEAIGNAGGAQAVFAQLGTVVGQLAAQLVPLLTTILQLVPAFTSSLSILNAILVPVNALAKAFNLLGPALTPLITGFVALKTAKTIFAGLQVAFAAIEARLLGTSVRAATANAALKTQNKTVIALRAAIQQLSAVTAKYTTDALAASGASNALTGALGKQAIAAKGAAGAGAAAGVAAEGATAGASKFSKVAAVGGPIVQGALLLGVAAWELNSQASQKATENAEKYFQTVTQGFSNKSVDERIALLRQEEELAKQRERDAEKGFSLTEDLFGGRGKQHRREFELAREAREDAELEKEFITRLGAETGTDYSQALSIAAAAGIDLTQLDDILKEKGKAGIESLLIGAVEGFQTSGAVSNLEQAADDALSKAFSQFDSITNSSRALESANKAVTSSQKDQAEAVKNLNELYAKKKELLADTGRDVRELADANRDLEKSEITLRELLEDQAQLPTDREALLDRRTLAAIKYDEALRELNETTEENNSLNKEAGISANIAGLNPDQIKSTLKNAREAAKANRRDAEETAKTEAERREEERIAAEEKTKKEIAVRDAKREQDDIDQALIDNEQKQHDIVGQIADAQQVVNDKKLKVQSIQDGNTSRAKELLEVDQQIVSAEEAVAAAGERTKAAKEAARDAAWDYRRAVAEAKDDEAEILRILQEQVATRPAGERQILQPAVNEAGTAVNQQTQQQQTQASAAPRETEQQRILRVEREDKFAQARRQLFDEGIVTTEDEFQRLFVQKEGRSFQGALDSILISTLRNDDIDVFARIQDRFFKQGVISGFLSRNFGATEGQIQTLLNDEQFNKEVLNKITFENVKDINSTVRRQIREILKRLGMEFPGFRHGGLVGQNAPRGGQLVVVGEDNKEELILPLRGTKERALELMAQAVQVANPAIATLLRRAIGGEKTPSGSGFKYGGIVGGGVGHYQDGGIVKGGANVPQPLVDISEQVSGVNRDVDTGFEDVNVDLETQDSLIRKLFVISRNLTKTLISQQQQLVTLNTAVTSLSTAVTVTIPAQIAAFVRVQEEQAVLLSQAALSIQAINTNVNNLATAVTGLLSTASTQQGSIGNAVTALSTIASNQQSFNTRLTSLSLLVETLTNSVQSGFLSVDSLVSTVQTFVSLFESTVTSVNVLISQVEDLAEITQKIARRVGVPGAAEGAVITGTPGAFGQLLRVGEYNRPEAVVPLTNKENMLSVLKRSIPYAAPGVRSVLENMLTPEEGHASGVTVDLSPSRATLLGGTGNKKEQQEIASAVGNVIADRLIAAGVGQGQSGPINITLEGSDFDEINARKIQRELERRRNRF